MFSTDTFWILWIVGGLLLAILEIFTSGFLLLSFSIPAIITGIFAYFGVSIEIQLAIFSVLTLAMFISIRPILIKKLYNSKNSKESNASAIIGKIARVEETLKANGTPGYVKIDGDVWRAVLKNSATDAENDEQVKVIELDSITLIVNKLKT